MDDDLSIVVKTTADVTQADSQIQSFISKYQNKPIKIQIDTSSITNAFKSLDFTNVAKRLSSELNAVFDRPLFKNLGSIDTSNLKTAMSGMVRQMNTAANAFERLKGKLSLDGKNTGLDVITKSLQEIQSLLTSISEKNLNVQNIFSFNNNNNNNNGIAAYKEQARELLSVLDDLSARMHSVSGSAMGKVYSPLKKEFATLDSMNLSDLGKRIDTSRTTNSVQALIAEAQKYKSAMESILNTAKQYDPNISMPDYSKLELATQKVKELEATSKNLEQSFINAVNKQSGQGLQDQTATEQAKASVEQLKTAYSELETSFEGVKGKIESSFDFSQPISGIQSVKQELESIGAILDQIGRKAASITFTPPTTGLRPDQVLLADFENAGAVLKQKQEAAAALEKQIASPNLTAFKEAAASIKINTGGIQDSTRYIQAAYEAAKQFDEALLPINSKLASISLTKSPFGDIDALVTYKNELGQAASALVHFKEDLEVDAGRTVYKTTENFAKAEQQAVKMESTFSKLGDTIAGLKSSIQQNGDILGTDKLNTLAQSLSFVEGEFQKVQASFKKNGFVDPTVMKDFQDNLHETQRLFSETFQGAKLDNSAYKNMFADIEKQSQSIANINKALFDSQQTYDKLFNMNPADLNNDRLQQYVRSMEQLQQAQEDFKSRGLGAMPEDFEKLREAAHKASDEVTKLFSDQSVDNKAASQIAKQEEAVLSQARKWLDDLQKIWNEAFNLKDPSTGDYATKLIEQWDQINAKVHEYAALGAKAEKSQADEIRSMFNRFSILREQQRNAQWSNTDYAKFTTETAVAKYSGDIDKIENQMKSAGTYTDDFKEKVDNLRKSLGSIGDAKGVAALKSQIEQLKLARDKFESTARGQNLITQQGLLDQISSKMPGIDNLLGKEIIAGATTTGLSELRSNIEALKTDYQGLAEQIHQVMASDTSDENKAQQLANLKAKVEELAKQYQVLGNEVKKAESPQFAVDQTKVEGLSDSLKKLENDYSRVIAKNPELAQRIEEFKAKLATADGRQLKPLSAELTAIGKQCRAASSEAGNFGQIFRSSFGSVGGIIAMYASTTRIFMKVVQGIKSMINNVRELDTSLVELQKVTNLSGKELETFTQNAFDMGNRLGRTGKDVTDAVTTFSRAGYDLQESMDLSEAALVMTNIGADIDSTETAASHMISILKAYGVEASEAMSIIDKLYNVSNLEPIDFGNITSGLVTVGGTLSQTGTSIEQSIAMITGGFATMRDTSKVANGLIMISQRLRGVSEDGEAIDGLVPKLKELFGTVGISLENENGELRSTYEVLNDLAGVWDSISSKQKQLFGEKVAGNRQVKILNALMQNWDIVQRSLGDAAASDGTAMQGNELYAQSIEGRINKLKSAIQELSQTTIDSGFIKFWVDAARGVVEFTTKIGGLQKVIKPLIAFFTITNWLKIGKVIGAAFSNIGAFFSSWQGGVLVAITGLAFLMSKLEESANRVKNQYNTYKESYSEHNSNIDDLNSQLQETEDLMKDLEGRRLTPIEQEEYDRLVRTNSELEKRKKLEEDLANSDRDRMLDSGSELVHQTLISRSRDTSLGARLGDVGKQVLGAIDPELIENMYSNTYEYDEILRNAVRIAEDDDSILQWYDRNKSFIEGKNESLPYASFLQGYIEALPIYNRRGNPDDPTVKAIKTVLNDYVEFVFDTLGEELYTGENLTDSQIKANGYIQRAQDIQAMLYTSRSSQWDYASGKYSEEFEKAIGQFSESIAYNEIDWDQLFAGMPRFVDVLRDYGWTDEQIRSQLYAAIAESTRAPSESTSDTVGSLIGKYSELAEEAYSTTDAYEALTKAISEQETAGKISAATMAALIAQDAEYGNMLEATAGGYKLNTDAVYDYIKAQDKLEQGKAINRIKEIRDLLNSGVIEEGSKDWLDLTNEMHQLEMYVMDIDQATDALSRLTAARKSANADANYQSVGNLYEELKKASDIGKTNTDDYNAALDYILGEDWESRYTTFEAANKELLKRTSKYNTGDDAKNWDNFYDLLEDNGFINNGELVETTYQEIAKALGSSEEWVRDMFGLGSTFNRGMKMPEMEITDTGEAYAEGAKQIEAYEEKIASIQTRIDELKEESSGKDVTPERQQQIQDEIKLLTYLSNGYQALIDNSDVTPDTTEGRQSLEDIAKQLQEIYATNGEVVDIPFETSGKYDEVKALLEQLDKDHTVTVDVETNQNGDEHKPEESNPKDTVNTGAANQGTGGSTGDYLTIPFKNAGQKNVNGAASVDAGVAFSGTGAVVSTVNEAFKNASGEATRTLANNVIENVVNSAQSVKSGSPDAVNPAGIQSAVGAVGKQITDAGVDGVNKVLDGVESTASNEDAYATLFDNSEFNKGMEEAESAIVNGTADGLLKSIGSNVQANAIAETTKAPFGGVVEAATQLSGAIAEETVSQIEHTEKQVQDVVETTPEPTKADHVEYDDPEIKDAITKAREYVDAAVSLIDNRNTLIEDASLIDEYNKSAKALLEHDEGVLFPTYEDLAAYYNDPSRVKPEPTYAEPTAKSEAQEIADAREALGVLGEVKTANETLANSTTETASAIAQAKESLQEPQTSDSENGNIGETADTPVFNDAFKELQENTEQGMRNLFAAAAVMMNYFNQGGNVDLLNRPHVPASAMAEAGWSEFEGEDSYATLYSDSDHRLGFNGEIGLVLTPIYQTEDGVKVKSPQELEEYYYNLMIDDMGNFMPESDPLGLVVSSMNLEDLGIPMEQWDSFMGQYGYNLHLVQEFYDELQGYELDPVEVDAEVNPEELVDSAQSALEDTTVGVNAEVTETEQPEIPDEVEAGVSFDLNSVSGLEEMERMVSEALSEAGKFSDPDVSAFASELESASSDVWAAYDRLSQLSPSDAGYEAASADLDAAASNFQSAYNNLARAVGMPKTVNVYANTSPASNAIDRLSNKTVTVTVVTRTIGEEAYAKGTNFAKGGLSLVDEKGAELIEHTKTGTYEIGTNSGARLVNLQPGDVVHTAKETKSILRRAADFFGGAFAGGNLAVAAYNTKKKKSISGLVWDAMTRGLSAQPLKKSGSSKKSSSSSKKSSGSSKKKSSGGGSSRSSSSNSDIKDYVDNLFDWIEVRLDRLDRQTENWKDNAAAAIGYIARNSYLDKAIATTQEQIDAANQAYTRYVKQADTIASKFKLSADIYNRIKDGTIDISSYDEDTRTKISAVKEWYDKALDARDSIADLQESITDLAAEKLDNVLDTYQYRINRLEAVADLTNSKLELKRTVGKEIFEDEYEDAIVATTDKVKELVAEHQTLQDEFESVVKAGYIKEGSEEWDKYTAELEDLEKEAIDAQKDLQELVDEAAKLPVEKLAYALETLENLQNVREDWMNLHEAQGIDNVGLDYDYLIRNGMEQIQNLQEQNKLLREQQSGLDVLSEKYQDLEEEINKNESAIMDMMTQQEKWNDAALDLEISQIEKYRDGLDKVNDAYQKQKDLQEAIEALEKARRQRTNRVYREGVGFVYEADQDAIKQAQDNLDQILHDQTMDKIDEIIDAINELKNDSNVYDAEGNLLGQQYALPEIGSYEDLLASYSANTILNDAVQDAKKAAYEQVMSGITNNDTNSIQIGDIIVNGADNVQALVEAIQSEFPTALLQAIHGK